MRNTVKMFCLVVVDGWIEVAGYPCPVLSGEPQLHIHELSVRTWRSRCLEILTSSTKLKLQGATLIYGEDGYEAIVHALKVPP